MKPCMTICLLIGILLAMLMTVSAFGQPGVGKGGGPDREKEWERGWEKKLLPTDHPHSPDTLLVGFKSEVARSARGPSIHASQNAQRVHSYRRIPVDVVRVPRGADLNKLIAAYQARPDVAYAEPDYEVSLVTVPNDPLFGNLWALNNTGQTGGTPGADISALDAWAITTGSQDVIVAVIDTGIDWTHPDLAANMWQDESLPVGHVNRYGAAFIDGTGTISNTVPPMDDNFHGTHVAGTIGAVGNNQIGVVGVNHNVKLMAVKFLRSDGGGTTSDAIAAIEYATAKGAHLSNNSWGGAGYSKALKDAIDAAGAAGQLFVAAAGNSNYSNDLGPSFPASYRCDNIISVAASDHDDERAWFSNWGLTSVHLAAPGVNILSTVLPIERFNYDIYGSVSGTSMAAPHVAGVAALLLAANPNVSYEELKHWIITGVDQLPQWENLVFSKGRLNAAKALEMLELMVTPYIDITFEGYQHGPFNLAENAYTLKNTGSQPLDWAITADQNWVSITPSSGTLAASATVQIDISMNAQADLLHVGTYQAVISFENLDTNWIGTRNLYLNVKECLTVNPDQGFDSERSQGGPYNQDSKTYWLENRGSIVVNWTADAADNWVTITPSSGSLDPYASSYVTLSMNQNADALAEGRHTNVVTFTNIVSGGTCEVDVTLTVRVPLYVDTSATGANDGSSWADAYVDLQDALSAAQDWHGILVAAGTYKPTSGTDRTISFEMKDNVGLYGGFAGTEDPAAFDLSDRDFSANETILSGDIGIPNDPLDNSHRVIRGASNAVLDGFTITGGYATAGGGGGGMRNFDVDNLIVKNCTFSGNYSSSSGGGMWSLRSTLTVIDCLFINNSAVSYGGGLYNNRTSAFVSNCTFIGNSITDPTYSYGGGMSNTVRSNSIVTNCTFINNSAPFGGGLSSQDSSPVVANCIFIGNSASNQGGGMSFHYAFEPATPTITNCTFSGNTAVNGGASLTHLSYLEPRNIEMANCIFWDGYQSLSYGEEGTITVSYSNIQGGWTGLGNIDSDPLFVDAANGDLRLQSGSPCIDAGFNAAVPLWATTDLDGNPRIVDGTGDDIAIVDMGAYEYQLVTIIYVNSSATGVNDGSSWTDAFTDLQDAFSTAESGNHIWVAAGTYKPTSGTDRTISFEMKDNIGLFGGFVGIEDPFVFDLADRDFAVNETILSGDIGIPNDSSDNSYTVLKGASDSILDGFTITGGYGSVTGAGMRNFEVDNLIVKNCIFSGNSATNRGGGMWSIRSTLTVTDCLFINNYAGEYGGGMNNHRSSANITNCTFIGNSSNDMGGGMNNSNFSNSIVTNCVFIGNSAVNGGGMGNMESSPIVSNCSYIDNSASQKGGGMYFFLGFTSDTPVISNCTFTGNTALNGASLVSEFYSTPAVDVLMANCIFWDGLDSLWSNHMNALLVSYSNVQGGWTGVGNIDADPLFVDAANGDVRLQFSSPCIDTGSNAAVPAWITTDLDGDPRIVDGTGDDIAIVDMGAYEYQLSFVTISGIIELEYYIGDVTLIPVTVEIRSPGTTNPLETHIVYTDSQENYSLQTPFIGTYDIAAKGYKWLRHTHSNIDTTGGAIVDFLLITGDAVENNEVDWDDFALVVDKLGTIEGDPDWDPRADLNGDGEVCWTDYNIVIANFGLFGDD